MTGWKAHFLIFEPVPSFSSMSSTASSSTAIATPKTSHLNAFLRLMQGRTSGTEIPGTWKMHSGSHSTRHHKSLHDIPRFFLYGHWNWGWLFGEVSNPEIQKLRNPPKLTPPNRYRSSCPPEFFVIIILIFEGFWWKVSKKYWRCFQDALWWRLEEMTDRCIYANRNRTEKKEWEIIQDLCE